MLEGRISIYFDGGCRPTNPGNKYGSYEIAEIGGSYRRTLEFGWGTNNEAEFESLLAGLEHLGERLSDSGRSPADFALQLFTDSTIVRNRILRRNTTNKSEPQQRMFALTERCLRKLVRFRSFSIEWNAREANVERFGH